MLEVRLLGRFEIRHGKKTVDLNSRPAQSLFAFLILNAGTAYRREKLAGQLWPDSTEEGARDYLRHALWRIRKALQPTTAISYLQANDLTISFDTSSKYWLDAAALQEADEAGPTDQLAEALSAYTGELLPGFYDEWVVLEREHLQAVYERKVGRLLELLQAAGQRREVLAWAEKWIALGQKPESAYRYLMSAYAAQGDMAKAAATYARCVKSLAEYGVEPSEETSSLYEQLKAGKGSKPAQPKTVSGERSGDVFWNVPRPLTSFIGREHEIVGVVRLLEAHKLVTLTGSGGVGKTRLAMQVANRRRDNFIDGVCWVELASISDSSLVPHAVASSLGVRESPGKGLSDCVREYLAPRELLLILDNCEHVILACAQLAELLAGSCPHLKILTTSREALGIQGERLYEVPPLSVPKPERRSLVDLLLEYESVRLFVERARTVQPDFELTERNASGVQQICQQLDGVPLALELAAARTRLLTVEHIAERLHDRFNLLTQGNRTALPRHQTLRATIDWSYDQLPEEACILFRRLSVFAGGFTLEAVEAVCSGSPLSRQTALDVLGRLVDRSLVRVQRQPSQERHSMLETIRQYGIEKLRAAGEESGLRSLHLEFFLHRVEQAEPKLLTDEQKTALLEMDAEYGNLRAALEWGAQTDAARALRLTAALGNFYRVRGYFGEGRKALEQALERAAEAPKEVRAKGLLYAGGLSIDQGDYPRANESLQASLKLWRELGDQRGLAKSLNYLGLVAWSQGEDASARRMLEESLGLFRKLADSREIANVLSNLGNVAVRQSDYLTARRYQEEAVALMRESGDQIALASTLNNLGVVAEGQNDYAAARRSYLACISIANEFGAKNMAAYALNGLAHVIYLQGEPLQAKQHYGDSLVIFREIGEKRGIAYCLEGFATVNSRYGGAGRAARLLGSAEALRQAIGAPLSPAESAEIDQDLIAVRGQLGDEAFNAAWALGRTMSLEQATAFALEEIGVDARSPDGAPRLED